MSGMRAVSAGLTPVTCEVVHRLGISVPFYAVPLAEQRARLAGVAAAGHAGAWSPQAEGTDDFTHVALGG